MSAVFYITKVPLSIPILSASFSILTISCDIFEINPSASSLALNATENQNGNDYQEPIKPNEDTTTSRAPTFFF